MKKRVLWSVLAVAFVLAWIGVPAPRPGALAGAGGDAAGNGDVNGDGRINIADAIYLVNFLFRSGPGPVAIAQTAAPTWPPRPADIVNVDSLNLNDPDRVFSLAYEVPSGKFLVVTNVSIQVLFGTFGGEVLELTDDGHTVVRLGPQHFPAREYDDPKQGARLRPDPVLPNHWSSPVGIVFSPGSKVLIKTQVGDVEQFSLVGYLTDR